MKNCLSLRRIATFFLLVVATRVTGQDFPIIEAPYVQRPEFDLKAEPNDLSRLVNTAAFGTIGELGHSYKSVLDEYGPTKQRGPKHALSKREHNIVDELKLSPDQLKRLTNIAFLQPAHLYQPADIPKDDKELETFAEAIKAQYQTQWRVSNLEVAEVLRAEQLQRLKQIVFQIHTLRYHNLKAALSHFDQEISNAKSRKVSGELGQIKLRVRGLSNYLGEFYAHQALKDVLGQAKLRALMGSPFAWPVDETMLAILDEDEQPKAILGEADEVTATLKFDDVATRKGMSDWIMHENSSLTKYVLGVRDKINLSDEQVKKLASLKPLPNRSSYEFSYVVAKTGLTERNFKDPAIKQLGIDASMAARNEYAQLQLKHKSEVAELLTQSQRDRLRQLEFRLHVTRMVPDKALEFYGVPISNEQRAELQTLYDAIPQRVHDRIFELRFAKARDELAKFIGDQELQRMLGDPFRPILDRDRGHISLEDSLDFQKRVKDLKAGRRRRGRRGGR